eukprot:11976810-Alexandrium_andersonii.AAC.1
MFLGGQKACLKGWLAAVHISRSRFNRLLHWLDEGHFEPPADMRHSKGGPANKASVNADALFQWIWQHLAEPMVFLRTGPEADGDFDMGAKGLQLDDLRVNDSLTEWVAGPGASTVLTQSATEIRWLQSMPL